MTSDSAASLNYTWNQIKVIPDSMEKAFNPKKSPVPYLKGLVSAPAAYVYLQAIKLSALSDLPHCLSEIIK